MARRKPYVVLACFLGCVLGGLIGHGIQAREYNVWIAFVAATILPTSFCIIAGLRDRHQILKLAVYAGVGWALTFILRPRVAGINVPPAPPYWFVYCSVVSLLLALVAVSFMPKESLPR